MNIREMGVSSENYRDRIFTVPTGGIGGRQYREQLTNAGVSYVTAELESPQLQKPQKREDVHIILLLPGEFSNAQKQGLSLGDAPWDTLPSTLLNEQGQISEGWTFTRMKPVTDRYGPSFGFFVYRFGVYLELRGHWAGHVPYSFGLVAVRVLRK